MLQSMDSIIRTLGFLDLDANDPRLTHFADHQVPSIESVEQQAMDSAVAAVVAHDPSHAHGHQKHNSYQQHGYANSHSQSHSVVSPVVAAARLGGDGGLAGTTSSSMVGGQSLGIGIADGGCSCTLFKISTMNPRNADTTPFWLATPGWNSSWTMAETKYEEQRRLVWSALTLAAAHVSYANSLGEPPLDLAITKPWMVRSIMLPSR